MDRSFKLITIGLSAGGMNAMQKIIPSLRKDLSAPIVIVQHLHPNQSRYYIDYFDRHSAIRVCEAEEKQNPLPGYVYFAPPNYHLMIEDDGAFALSVSEKVNYSRPSIDVLFETAAWVHKSDLVGIIMTGANHDGAKGLKKIKDNGGLTIVQDPATADVSVMPGAAIQVAEPDYILSIENIIDFLNNIGYQKTR